MSSTDCIEKILDLLLINTRELNTCLNQEKPSGMLLEKQRFLLSQLFMEWNQLTEEDQRELLRKRNPSSIY